MRRHRTCLRVLLGLLVPVSVLQAWPAGADMIVDLEIPGVIIHEKSGGRIAGISEKSSFSLHAGAQAGTAMDIRHNPATGQPASANVMPTTLTTRRENGRDFRVAVPSKLPSKQPIPYVSTKPKGYNDGIVKSSGQAAQGAGNPPNTTTSTAEVKVLFKATPQGGPPPKRTLYEAIPEDAVMSIFQQGPRPPFGAVSTLILDPVELTADQPGGDAVQPGDTLSGNITLTAANFSVMINGPDAVFATTMQIGSDYPVGSSPSFDTSYQGLPLVFSFGISFESGRLLTPDIFLDSNSNYSFFDPDTSTLLSPSAISGFVRDRILSHLTFSGPDTVTLDQSTLDVLDWSGTATDTKSTVLADYTVAQYGLEGVPAPTTLVLLALGAAMVSIMRWRAGRGQPAAGRGAGSTA